MLPDSCLLELTDLYRARLPNQRMSKNTLDPVEVATIRSIAELCPVSLTNFAKMTPIVHTKKRDRKVSEKEKVTHDRHHGDGMVKVITIRRIEN